MDDNIENPGVIPSILRAQNDLNNVLDDVRNSRGSFVERFTDSFSNNRNGQPPAPTGRRHAIRRQKRGRPAQPQGYIMKICALDDPGASRRPESWKVLQKLSTMGLGRLPEDTSVPADLNAEQFTEFLWEKFPRLRGNQLSLKRADLRGNLVDLPAGTKTPGGIKNRRRCLYVVPATRISNTACPQCSRTLTGNDCILCEQDAEYQQTLEDDRQKERDASVEACLVSRLTQLRSERAEALTSVIEPDGGITVRCRLPHGSTIQRKFNIDDPVTNLLVWIGSSENATEDFHLNIPGQPVLAVSATTGKLLGGIGVDTSCLIIATWIEKVADISTAPLPLNPPSTSGTAPPMQSTVRQSLSGVTTAMQIDEVANNSTAPPPLDRPSTSGTAPPMQSTVRQCLSGVTATPTVGNSSGTPTIVFPLVNPHHDSDDDFDLTQPVGLDVPEQIVDEEMSPSPDVDTFSIDEYSDEFDWKAELRILQSQISEDHIPTANCINVVREQVLNCAMRALRRKAFDPLKRFNVMFIDGNNKTEGAVDNGGPSREFLRLLLRETIRSPIFEGPAEARQLALSTDALSKKTYFQVGRVFALTLLHQGPAPACLSQNLYRRVTGQKTNASIDDVQDETVKLVLQKIKEASSMEEINEEILKGHDTLALLGTVRHVRSRKQRDALVADCLNFYLYDRLHSAEEQFIQGLDTGGLLTEIKKNPLAFQHLFIHKHMGLDRTTLLQLFHPVLSVTGSNRRKAENVILSFWRDWLIDIEDGESEVSFKEVLVFVTCLDEPPPLGFDASPAMEFLHDGGIFPTANTCNMTLRLPVQADYDDWKCNMETGIRSAPTFGVN